ncbi:MAG: hypothetical protein N4A71_03385 [Carboxylicivirga sp.]|jgi:hypothetical protein|nr:hypothetical protein [Carboxylicivirga sp.]
MIVHKFNDKRKVLESKINGQCTYIDLLLFVESIIVSVKETDELRIQLIIPDDSLRLDIKDLQGIWQFSKRLLHKYKNVRIAIIVNDPHQTALSFLFSSFVDNPHYQVKVFSTIAVANRWLCL